MRALAMDILLPCVPNIAEEFAVSFSQSQWILSVYFISAGLGQLFVGPLADEYGCSDRHCTTFGANVGRYLLSIFWLARYILFYGSI